MVHIELDGLELEEMKEKADALQKRFAKHKEERDRESKRRDGEVKKEAGDESRSDV